jgi:hypothetical protein
VSKFGTLLMRIFKRFVPFDCSLFHPLRSEFLFLNYVKISPCHIFTDCKPYVQIFSCISYLH